MIKGTTAAGEVAAPATEEAMVVTKGPHVTVAGKTLNPCGIFICLLTMSCCACCYPPLLLAYTFSKLFDNKKRRTVDYIVNMWAKTSMLLCTYRPKVPPHT